MLSAPRLKPPDTPSNPKAKLLTEASLSAVDLTGVAGSDPESEAWQSIRGGRRVAGVSVTLNPKP